ncbi:MAG: hypothetical protein DMG02_34115, partial [Acidobacteria bacterium]
MAHQIKLVQVPPTRRARRSTVTPQTPLTPLTLTPRPSPAPAPSSQQTLDRLRREAPRMAKAIDQLIDAL